MLKTFLLTAACCFTFVIWSACTFSVDYQNSRFQCTSSQDCPQTFTCLAGHCYPKGTTPPTPKCDGGTCVETHPKDKKAQKKPCKVQTDCSDTETCRPPTASAEQVCVPLCYAPTQSKCKKSQVCVVFEKRAYCEEELHRRQTGQLCGRDIDCELHLYCRPVDGFSFIKRCSPPCLVGKGCEKNPKQKCISLGKKEAPYGYCQPTPTLVDKDELCGGDLLCKPGLTCRLGANQLKRCLP